MGDVLSDEGADSGAEAVGVESVSGDKARPSVEAAEVEPELESVWDGLSLSSS